VGLSPEGGLGGVGGFDSSTGRSSPAAGMEKRSLGGVPFLCFQEEANGGGSSVCGGEKESNGGGNGGLNCRALDAA
jgi:hypothetical protein